MTEETKKCLSVTATENWFPRLVEASDEQGKVTPEDWVASLERRVARGTGLERIVDWSITWSATDDGHDYWCEINREVEEAIRAIEEDEEDEDDDY